MSRLVAEVGQACDFEEIVMLIESGVERLTNAQIRLW
jgi:hypothetical protein